MSELTFSSRVVRNSDLISTDMDGETVMMSVEKGKYFGLSGVGPFLWENMEEPVELDILRQRVFDNFDIDDETSRTDVLEFVGRLLEDELVKIV